MTPDVSSCPAERPSGTQPGGHGFFTRCEIAWGRLRRWFLRRFCPRHVSAWRKRRLGDDPTFDADVIDPRDLKYIRPVCAIEFRKEDDIYARREHHGFARWGYAELVGFSIVLLAFVGLFCYLAGAFHWLFLLPALIAIAAELEVLWFFRDPPRTPPGDPSALVSPADGVVTHVETLTDPDFPSPVVRISIFLSVFNVHVNRIPQSSRVTAVRYWPGKYLDARHADCAVQNEQLWIDLEDSATNTPLRVKQIAGAIARRIVCVLKPGDVVTLGERFGMIKFGSRTDVLIPQDRVASVSIKVGDRVYGAHTVLLRVR
jgi:phosphatidylserine decarboxylase